MFILQTLCEKFRLTMTTTKKTKKSKIITYGITYMQSCFEIKVEHQICCFLLQSMSL